MIEGEIQAGNDNLQLINELRVVLEKMVNIKLINEKDARSYYKQFL